MNIYEVITQNCKNSKNKNGFIAFAVKPTPPMKIIYLLALLFCSFCYAQDTEVINWIDKNAIVIGDANPDTELTYFSQHSPDIFKDTRVFGFGEASHHHKEFFDIKIKFFKYLVKNKGVTVFAMEESFGAANAINRYLHGGDGDARQLVLNLRHGIWRNESVLALVIWMKAYNEGKPDVQKLKFYGVDNMFGYKTNDVIKAFISKYAIVTNASTITVLDNCAVLNYPYKNVAELQEYKKQLDEFKLYLKSNFKSQNTDQAAELEVALHAVTSLIQYSDYIANPNQDDRDKAMADNVEWALNHEGKDAKVFVWAHNDHINKTKLHKSDIVSMGNWLHQKYGSGYYSMGFDFGTGEIIGMRMDKTWEHYTIDIPVRHTAAVTLYKAQPDMYLIDCKEAAAVPEMLKFLSKTTDYVHIGGGGLPYKALGHYRLPHKINAMYDGLIFVRNISLSQNIK